jgi:hypothetical protein
MSSNDLAINLKVFLDIKASRHALILANTTPYEPVHQCGTPNLSATSSLSACDSESASVVFGFFLWPLTTCFSSLIASQTMSPLCSCYQQQHGHIDLWETGSQHRGVRVVRCACVFLWHLSGGPRQGEHVGGEAAGSSQGEHGTTWDLDRV